MCVCVCVYVCMYSQVVWLLVCIYSIYTCTCVYTLSIYVLSRHLHMYAHIYGYILLTWTSFVTVAADCCLPLLYLTYICAYIHATKLHIKHLHMHAHIYTYILTWTNVPTVAPNCRLPLLYFFTCICTWIHACNKNKSINLYERICVADIYAHELYIYMFLSRHLHIYAHTYAYIVTWTNVLMIDPDCRLPVTFHIHINT
jgi:hypothetical protein